MSDLSALWPIKTSEVQTATMDSTIWNDIAMREDDIFICTYPKSGTTWMQQIVSQILFQGEDDVDISARSPWIDQRIPREQMLAWVEKVKGRRFLKSHVPLNCIKYSPSAKYINVARDGRDVAWSLYAHFRGGLFPWIKQMHDVAGSGHAPTRPTDPREFYLHWLQSDDGRFMPFFPHIRSWWEYRHLPNIKLVHYADLKANLPGQIRDIAAFLNTPIDERWWPRLLERCSFEYMQANARKIMRLRETNAPGMADSFFNKGINRRWADVLSPEENAEYQARARRELGDDCGKWLGGGGTTARS